MFCHIGLKSKQTFFFFLGKLKNNIFIWYGITKELSLIAFDITSRVYGNRNWRMFRIKRKPIIHVLFSGKEIEMLKWNTKIWDRWSFINTDGNFLGHVVAVLQLK